MKFFRLPVIFFSIVSLAATLLVTPAQAYAFSLQDLLGSTTTATTSSSDKPNLVDLLLGLLLGKFLGQPVQPTGTTAPSSSGSMSNRIGSKEVVGFYAEWYGTDEESYQDFAQHKSQIQTIAPFWATLQKDGSLTDRGGNDHSAAIQLAHQNHRSVLLLVNNATDSDTTPPIDTLLKDPALRRTAIDHLEETIKKQHLDGVNIDFEMVPAADRDQLTSFMRELYQRLKPEGYTVSIDVFPKENENNDVSVAYDYGELKNYADKIMLMTYDNHGTWSDAGPIADIGWDERCVKYALQFIPKSKLYLGLAGYGYDWSSSGVESLEYSAITTLTQKYGADVLWDDSAKAPHFTYNAAGVSHEVWFENSRSTGYKLDLMNRYDLAGIALWKLGEEDPGIWPVIQAKM